MDTLNNEVSQLTKDWLDKELWRTECALQRAGTKPNVPEQEVIHLRAKLGIIKELKTICGNPT